MMATKLIQDNFDVNTNKTCFLFISMVHIIFIVVLISSYGKEFLKRCKRTVTQYAFVCIGEKLVTIAFYCAYEYLKYKNIDNDLDPSIFAVIVRVVAHISLSIALIGEVATTTRKRLLVLPCCIVLFIVQYTGVHIMFNTEVKEVIPDQEAFVVITSTSVFNMTLLIVFCFYIGFVAEKTKSVNKILGFHAIVDILYNFLIQSLLATNYVVYPSALILVNYAKDLFFLFVYVVRVMNASIVEVGDSDTISTISIEDVEIVIDSPRSDVQMVKY
ncbi:unnamed protein product [Bursaphelenchus okinawaensis]|uniref:Uncharacterized protein n=1 Tax=Bursaphelenchus okinawaensis TaxID=465554 RepID=A0A811KK28_9BILA|nr:unnamed protein product [Bursaphelenchus okinawaensis]CAG9105312.1 unnamed protein product [Bursaphelenchus okinawaensis]